MVAKAFVNASRSIAVLITMTLLSREREVSGKKNEGGAEIDSSRQPSFTKRCLVTVIA
jgi:hypothetical protein